MRKILVVVYLVIISIITYIPIADADTKGMPTAKYVSGTNDPNINGKYDYNGIYNGAGSWAKGDYSIRWSTVSMNPAWVIENTSNANQYYSQATITSNPPQTDWQCETAAASPCTSPVVKRGHPFPLNQKT